MEEQVAHFPLDEDVYAISVKTLEKVQCAGQLNASIHGKGLEKKKKTTNKMMWL